MVLQNEPFIDPLYKIGVAVSFLIKLQFWGPATQVLSCKICKLFKSNYFEEHLSTSASKVYLEGDSNTGVFLWNLWLIHFPKIHRRVLRKISIDLL